MDQGIDGFTPQEFAKGAIMKKFVTSLFIIISLLVISTSIYAQTGSKKSAAKGYDWSEKKPPVPPVWTKNAKLLPLIRVEGNRLVNSNGDTVLFHGLSVADLDNLEQRGQWSKNLFVEAKKLGATIVRLPVHPGAWRDRTPEKYLLLLDQAVEWCREESLYVDIDWHSIGNLEQGIYQDPSYYTNLQETSNFWRTIASRYTGCNTVAFLELFNEPTDEFGKEGNVSWDQWKKINEDLIKLIRAYNNESIPLVAGFDWAYDLTPLHFAPIDAEGIGYVVHPYPHKRTPPYEPKWDEDFGFAAAKYPLVATELGFTLPNRQANLDYGKTIIKYFNDNHISWVWWVLDPLWGPTMLESWKGYKLNEGGEFFEAAAHGRIAEYDSTAVH